MTEAVEIKSGDWQQEDTAPPESCADDESLCWAMIPRVNKDSQPQVVDMGGACGTDPKIHRQATTPIDRDVGVGIFLQERPGFGGGLGDAEIFGIANAEERRIRPNRSEIHVNRSEILPVTDAQQEGEHGDANECEQAVTIHGRMGDRRGVLPASNDDRCTQRPWPASAGASDVLCLRWLEFAARHGA